MTNAETPPPFTRRDGEMRALVEAKDWSATAIGPRETWSAALRLALDVILSSGFPMALRWGPEFVLIYNDGYRPILGDKHPWALGLPAREAWSEVWPQIEPLHRQILSGESEAIFAEDLLLRIQRFGDVWEDARFTLSYSPTPDPEAPGGIGGIFVTAVETTARVEAERRVLEGRQALYAANLALDAERTFLRDLFQHGPSFMAVLRGPEHRFELANDAYLQLVGNRPVVGKSVREALPEVEGQGFFEILDTVYASGEPFIGRRMPTQLQRASGEGMEERYVDLVYQPIRDAEGNILGIFVDGFDITERIAAEEALRRLNDTLELEVAARTRERDRLWRNSQDLLVVIDAGGAIRAANPSWTEILARDEREVVGRNYLEFVHPDDHEVARQALASALTDDLSEVEFRCLHKDGGERWFSWVASPEDDLVYASGRHVTAKKVADEALARVQTALHQSQKMEAIGQLTGGVAHDFNNMLAVVIGSLDIASRRLAGGDTDIERYLQTARDAAGRGATLTQRLLAFARQSPLAPRVTVVNSLVSAMSEMLRRTLGETIELETVLAGGLWPVHVDANQLESAILNLAVNARDAMPAGGRMTIETANAYLDDRYASQEIGVSPGQYVAIAVTDTGEGMPPEVLQKAFDPFFTTKPVGAGTGLGLSMVYGFAKQSGGHAKIYSEPGKGTTVRIYLARHYGAAADTAVFDASAPAPRAGRSAEVVLVVEDDPRVRQMSVEALRELGYAVHHAPGPEDALAMFDALGKVDVLFTDVVMPGMSGRQLAEALQRKSSALKVLYTTGYTRNAVVHNGMVQPGVQFLPKPFSVDELARKMRAVIDG